MPWTYSQSTGTLSLNNSGYGSGYSGTGPGRNNPADQNVQNEGPVPQGYYDIGAPHDTDHHGPYVMALTPRTGTNLFNRSGFLIHGDNRRRDASQGCIILDPRLRHTIWNSNDHVLQVIP
jgi:hypothetical protein